MTLPSKKTLSVFSLVMINIIAIDSIRNLPINAETGYQIITYYILGGLCFLLPCVLITAELATHSPKTGGAYVWVRAAFGLRSGFVSIWLLWIYNVVWFPTILTFVITTILYQLAPSLLQEPSFMVASVMLIFFFATLANCFGMRISSWVSSCGAVIGTIIPMALIIGLCAVLIYTHHHAEHTFHFSSLFPHWHQFNDLSFLVVIFFSLMGIEMSAIHAGEVKNPQRSFPVALIISSLFIILSLILASLAIFLVVPKGQVNLISGISQTFTLLLQKLGIEWFYPIAVLMIVLGAFAAVATWVLGPAKGMMVAAHEGCLPHFMCKTSRNGAPIGMLLTQAVIVALLSLMFLCFHSINTSYWLLSDLTAQLALLYYILLFAAAIRLRYKTKHNPNAFRIPGGNWGIWIVGLVGIGTCIVVIALGFIPPKQAHIGSVVVYEGILSTGITLFAIIMPIVVFMLSKRHHKTPLGKD